LLAHPEQIRHSAEKNYELARQHFSFQVLENKLASILASF
jgi:hypothetical protein